MKAAAIVQSTKNYSKNPITEALIDIQIEPVLGVAPTSIQEIHGEFADEFPEKKVRHQIKSTLNTQNPDAAPDHQVTIEGYQFWNTDKTEVIQCRRDGFSYSRLRPYEQWDIHFPKMYGAWQQYQNRFKPLKVKRLAVRFINLFEIPQTNFELGSYFNAAPQAPKGAPNKMTNFLQRFVVEDENNNQRQAMITFTTRRQTQANSTPIILDIDVFEPVSVAANAGGLDDNLNKLHLFAEEIFEAYITDKTRELIE